MSRASRGVLVGIVGFVVAAALVTVAVAAARAPVALPPDSPEGAVQAYLEAVLDHDHESAAALLDPAIGCGFVDLEMAYVDEDVHVSLRDVDTRTTTARVDVEITTGSGGLIPSGWSEEHAFRLVLRDGEWLVSGSPWPLYGCGEEVPR
ncbi:hypothetical protein [Nocardioides pacificus]